MGMQRSPQIRSTQPQKAAIYQPAFRSDGGRYGVRSSSKMWLSSVASRPLIQPSGQVCCPDPSSGAPSSGTNHACPFLTAVILLEEQSGHASAFGRVSTSR